MELEFITNLPTVATFILNVLSFALYIGLGGLLGALATNLLESTETVIPDYELKDTADVDEVEEFWFEVEDKEETATHGIMIAAEVDPGLCALWFLNPELTSNEAWFSGERIIVESNGNTHRFVEAVGPMNPPPVGHISLAAIA